MYKEVHFIQKNVFLFKSYNYEDYLSYLIDTNT